jgi:outer membrane protein assembly factor BamB
MSLHSFWAVSLGLFMLAPWAGAGEKHSWPQWRGPDRTDISKETGLLKTWPSDGPKKLWTYKEAGVGYSGFAVVDGKLYTMGARDGKEYLFVLDTDSGNEAWNLEIGSHYKNNFGDGPRGTPTVDGDRIYALGAQGNLVCISLADRKELWRKKMQDLGGKIPTWGYAESVLIDGDKVICTPGGSKGAVAALNKNNGEVIWQCDGVKDQAHYSSVIPAELHGVKQYVQLLVSAAVGIDASTGKLLWKIPFPGKTAVIPTPIVHDNHVYVAAGYSVGCKLIRLDAPDKASEVYFNQNMVNHHGGVVLLDGHLYGYSDGKGWVCQDFKSGEIIWSEKKLGKGCVTFADGMLYCMDERLGTVVLAEASPKGWKEHGRFKLEPQSKQRAQRGAIWTHPVVVNGRLYLRDQEFISCYDVKAK